jgi:anion transporter
MALNRENMAKLVVSALTLIVFLWVAVTSSITGRVLGVVLLALVFWSLYPQHYLVSSLAVIGMLSLFEASLSPQEFVDSLFSTYGGSGLWIIIAGFILAEAMRTSGLAQRIALWIVSALGGDPNMVVLSVALANLAVAPLSPSTTAKAFLLLPICKGLIDAFDVEKGRSRYATGVMMMSMAANNICSTGFLTATVPNPISARYIKDASSVSLGWVDWLRMALPLTLILLVASWLVCRWMFKPEVRATPASLERIRDMRSGLGPFSRGEMLVALVFSLSLLLLITERRLHINAGLVSLVLCLVLFIPRIGVLKLGGFAGSIPWGSIMLFAASLFLARAVGRWEVFDPVASSLFDFFHLSSMPHLVFIPFLILLSMFLHLFFTSTTVYATVMMPLVISLTSLHELQIQAVAIPVAFLTPIALILPVNTIPNIVFYSSGYFTQKQMILYGLLTSLVSVLLIILVGLPYWQLLGFLQI